jgi:rhodanese-related sulfurtransferase
MDWNIYLLVGISVVALVLLRRRALIPAAKAQTCLRQGALIVDVRTPDEFAARHLPKAVNIPLDTLRETLPQQVPDKQQVLLLHCVSGMRSGMAKGIAQTLGYPNAFNLGSYHRAQSIMQNRSVPIGKQL